MAHETMIDHTSISPGDHHGHTNALAFLSLWILGLVFNFVAEKIPTLDLDYITTLVYTWIFRGLTLLSLVLIIVLNWRKIKKKTE